MFAVDHLTISRRWLQLAPAMAFTVAVVGLASCGENKDPSSLPGKGLAADYGCMACHSTNGATGVGPTWKGLYGSQVTLDDGSTPTVDRAYLVRSIKDPAADVPQGNQVPMPKNNVPDGDVELIVDYIISLK